MVFIDQQIHKITDDKVLANYFLLKNYISDNEGDIVRSMDHGLKALNHFLVISDTIGLAKTYNNIEFNNYA